MDIFFLSSKARCGTPAVSETSRDQTFRSRRIDQDNQDPVKCVHCVRAVCCCWHHGVVTHSDWDVTKTLWRTHMSRKCCYRSAMTEVSFSARGMVYSGKCWKRNPQALFQWSTCVFVLFSCVRLIMSPRGVASDCNYPVDFCGDAAATAKCGRLVIVKLCRLIVVSSLHFLNWVLSLFVLLPLLNSANKVRQKDSVAISYVLLCQAMRHERCGHLGRGTYLNKATNGADRMLSRCSALKRTQTKTAPSAWRKSKRHFSAVGDPYEHKHTAVVHILNSPRVRWKANKDTQRLAF